MLLGPEFPSLNFLPTRAFLSPKTSRISIKFF